MQQTQDRTNAREARDDLGDVLELIGVSRTLLRLQETERGTSIQGCMNGAPQLGIAMGSEAAQSVGEVTERDRHIVRLRALTDGREWPSTPDDLRVARVPEVHKALKTQ